MPTWTNNSWINCCYNAGASSAIVKKSLINFPSQRYFETLAKKDSTEQIQQSEPEVLEREIKDDENSDNNIMHGEDSLS